jgi:hypothetical protein
MTVRAKKSEIFLPIICLVSIDMIDLLRPCVFFEAMITCHIDTYDLILVALMGVEPN